MKSVIICSFILALIQCSFAATVCNTELSYSSTLVTPCAGNDVNVLWPNYRDFSTYYKCADFGKPVLQNCPPNTYFTYYFQQCTDCTKFIPCPECEFLQKTTDVTCVNNAVPAPTTTTKVPTTTTKAPIVTKPTTTTTTNDPNATTSTKTPFPKRTTTTKAPSVPTPPSMSTPPTQGPSASTDIPMPPIVVTPVPGVPTPPNENVTPPSIPDAPPILTTVASA